MEPMEANWGGGGERSERKDKDRVKTGGERKERW